MWAGRCSRVVMESRILHEFKTATHTGASLVCELQWRPSALHHINPQAHAA